MTLDNILYVLASLFVMALAITILEAGYAYAKKMQQKRKNKSDTLHTFDTTKDV